jgi:hypothetical protein
LFVDVNTWSK